MLHDPKHTYQDSITAFDRASKSYDTDFSQTDIARRLRKRVQERLDANFKPGMLVLDIGCGTGDDAIHLARRGVSVVGCDFSAGMLSEANLKIKKAGHQKDIILRQIPLEGLTHLIEELPMGFDGVYSNFGPLNMVDDLRKFVYLNARLLEPGGKSVHVVMGRKPLFETVYFMMHGRFSRAFARWQGAALVPIGGSKIPCRFYQPYELMEEFDVYFKMDRVEALGLFLPPPYLYGHFRRRRKFYRKFEGSDRLFSRLPLFNTMGDHFIIELTREQDIVSAAA